MKAEAIHDDGRCQWLVFGRDPDKPGGIIDTNQYLVKVGGEAILLDPGGVEVFAPMLAAVVHHIPLEGIRALFASHQDPDIISSLGLWDRSLTKASLYAPKIWEGFIRHFGCDHIRYEPLPDEGRTIELNGRPLEFLPAHYLHSSANFHVWDPAARVLMSGDVGAALLPHGAPLFVDDFAAHVPMMKGFHERWMPSNEAKDDWIRRVRALDVEMLAPQHGAIFRGDDVGRFLDWFEALQVGSGLKATAPSGA